MIKRRISILVLLLSTAPIWAAEPLTFDSLWKAVARDPDCKPSEFPNFILMTCDREKTLWYFTKANHPAHPGVIKRYLVQKDGTWYAKEDGNSFASDAAQPAFKAWLAEIANLDLQAREALKKKQRQNSSAN